MKPATAATVNGLRFGQLGSVINQESNPAHRQANIDPPLPVGSGEMLATAAAIDRVRLRFLAEQIHSIGPHGLFELFAELVSGAPTIDRIERYGRLAHEYGAFIRAHGGDQFPPRLFIVNGSD
jgi:hypothetical protein